MREYRELEKLVTDWFSQGTGIETAIADLKKTGIKVSSRLGVPPPLSKEVSPNPSTVPVPVSEQMEIDPIAPAVTQIPTGPRVRS